MHRAAVAVEPEAGLTRDLPSEPSYDDLLRGLRGAAPEAITRLCECLGPKVNRFAQAWLVGDGAAAEEVTILALLDAIRNIARFNPGRSSLSAWLLGITRRKVQDELRTRRRRRSVPTASQIPMDAVAQIAAEGDMADVLSSRVAAQRQVAELAKVLSSLEFEVLMFSCADELSAPEIGRIIGRSGRAVHSILHRARSKARERLVRNG